MGLKKVTTDSKSSEYWKRKEQEKNVLYIAKYELPDITGVSDKQISYGISVRNHFIDGYEARYDSLSETYRNDVINVLKSKTTCNFWIDEIGKGKDCFDKYLQNHSVQTALPQTKQESVPVKSETFVIFVGNKDKISLRTADNTLDSQLIELKMTQVNDFYWEIPLLENDVERPLFLSNLQTLLLENDKSIKHDRTDTSPKKPTNADAKLTRINGKLAVICNTTETYRAFERIGHHLVYLNENRKDEIKPLLERYDVEIDDSVKGEFL